jgi:hypothetical protein
MPKRARRRSKRSILLPSDHIIEAQLAKLPHFEPYDTDQLLADARACAHDHGLDLDAAVGVVRYADKKEQAKQLLKALGEEWVSEPDDTNWRRGFVKLAGLHHGLGRIVYRPAGQNSNAQLWTLNADTTLLFEISRLKGQGLSERDAVANIASNPAYAEILPYREQTPGRRGKSRQRQPAAIRRHLQRLMEDARSVSNPMSRALGQQCESAFETDLWLLTDPPFSGDKRKRKKPSV